MTKILCIAGLLIQSLCADTSPPRYSDIQVSVICGSKDDSKRIGDALLRAEYLWQHTSPQSDAAAYSTEGAITEVNVLGDCIFVGDYRIDFPAHTTTVVNGTWTLY